MQVILLERVEKLGELGDAVEVRSGYGRNYLLPQGKAIRANADNLKRFEAEKAERMKQNDSKRVAAEDLKSKIHEQLVIIIRAASEAGHLYGSVTSRDISNAIKETFSLEIDRSMVVMTGSSKMLGIFDFSVRLHPEVLAIVRVNIAQSVEEAGLQADRVAQGLPALAIGEDAESDSRSKATIAAEKAILEAAKVSSGDAVEVEVDETEKSEEPEEKSEEVEEPEVKTEESDSAEE